MNELVRFPDNPITDGVLEVVSEEQKEQAAQSLNRIAHLLEEICSNEQKLASNYARLGAELHNARTNKYWIGWGFRSWGSYIASIEQQYNRSRSQLYHFIGISEVLLPLLGGDTLAQIGSSKAGELKRYVKDSGRTVPQNLLDFALDPSKTVPQLHAKVMSELHHPGEDKTSWYEFGGFYLTADEKLEVEAAIRSAKHEDPPVPHDIADHAQRREVFLRFAREFQSSYPDNS